MRLKTLVDPPGSETVQGHDAGLRCSDGQTALLPRDIPEGMRVYQMETNNLKRTCLYMTVCFIWVILFKTLFLPVVICVFNHHSSLRRFDALPCIRICMGCTTRPRLKSQYLMSAFHETISGLEAGKQNKNHLFWDLEIQQNVSAMMACVCNDGAARHRGGA